MRIIYLFIFSILHLFLFSQNITISGFVEDSESGERLAYANVYDTLSKIGVISNNYGFFSFSCKIGDTLCLHFSYIGYEPVEVIEAATAIKHINIKLKPSILLKEVIITAKHEKSIEQKTEMSVVSIPIKQIKLLPALGGESDILKAMQLMPGIKSGNEGTSGIYVRGGSPDQNLILIDDVPLYYVNHIGGLVSIFNTDAINNISLVKGGFPARYGGRLSSIIDIRMKDGNLNKFKGNAMIGMVASKISIEGPLKKDTSSYMISFRRFMYDLITRPLSKIIFKKTSTGYSFYDFNAKFNYKISNKNRLYFSIYSGKDAMNVRLKEKSSNNVFFNKNSIYWGNNLIAIRWNHIFNPKLFANSTISYTQYKYNTKFETSNKNNLSKDFISNNFVSGINDLAAKIDVEYFISKNYKMLLGANTIFHTFTPCVEKVKQDTQGSSLIDTTFGDISLKSFENDMYFENVLNIGKAASINAGLRFSHYDVEDTGFVNLSPRILINYIIGKNNSIKISYSEMNQNTHLLTNSGSGMPADLWLPATRKVIPQNSSQYALGVAATRMVFNNKFEISIEAFYKELRNTIAYKAGSNVFNATFDWQDKIEKNGKGYSKGIEVLIKKTTGKTTGWIGYTYSKTTRQFENINEGLPFLFKYDCPHDASIAITHNINKNINISLTWVYSTGHAITLPISAYSLITENGLQHIYVYKGINTFRMRDFHKMDIGLNFSKEKKWGNRTWSFSIYNLYNRQNPYYYFFERKQNNSNEVVLKQLTMFPFMPSISYSINF